MLRYRNVLVEEARLLPVGTDLIAPDLLVRLLVVATRGNRRGWPSRLRSRLRGGCLRLLRDRSVVQSVDRTAGSSSAEAAALPGGSREDVSHYRRHTQRRRWQQSAAATGGSAARRAAAATQHGQRSHHLASLLEPVGLDCSNRSTGTTLRAAMRSAGWSVSRCWGKCTVGCAPCPGRRGW